MGDFSNAEIAFIALFLGRAVIMLWVMTIALVIIALVIAAWKDMTEP